MASKELQDFAYFDDDQWRAFFAPYSHIVLVSNSGDMPPEELRAQFPPTTLFVFFNKVYKVLGSNFDASCVLVSRSGTMGANIVYRREVKDVLKFFDGQRFHGVINLCANPVETLSPASAFEGAQVRHLDLCAYLSDKYPSDKFATSGFALALWLVGLGVPGNIVLAGFTAKRSEKWKIFDVHDWNFEQTVLRIRARRGDIAMVAHSRISRQAAVFNALPDVPREEILAEALEVLANRLDDANGSIDRLMSLTKLQRGVQNFFRRIRPKTRKQRNLEKTKKD